MTNDQLPDASVLRILDAAINRAAEGLRVVEDYLRMVAGDVHLTRLAKELRHDLAAAAECLISIDRHTVRDTLGDVGTRISTEAEASRTDAWQVAAASFQRTAQALRSLEEYGKLVNDSFAAECEALRYRLYTLEKATSATQSSHERLADIRLYVLVGGDEAKSSFTLKIRALIEAGVQAIQLRDKRLADRELLACARLLGEITRDQNVLAIVNDRPDIAAAAEVDGVHLGQDDLPVATARRIIGPRKLIGVSTHSIQQAQQAVLDGADYLGAGPTFPTTTKSFDSFPGLEYLEQVAAEISLPMFAIGGIDAENLSEVIATGVSRVAVSSTIVGASEPATEIARLRELLAPRKRQIAKSPATSG
ncbi:MAG: thiamine phosphate synthase [Aeoliella sp.]